MGFNSTWRSPLICCDLVAAHDIPLRDPYPRVQEFEQATFYLSAHELFVPSPAPTNQAENDATFEVCTMHTV